MYPPAGWADTVPTGLTRLLRLGGAGPRPIRGEHSGESSSGGADANPPPFGQKFDFVCLFKIVINGGAFRGTSQR